MSLSPPRGPRGRSSPRGAPKDVRKTSRLPREGGVAGRTRDQPCPSAASGCSRRPPSSACGTRGPLRKGPWANERPQAIAPYVHSNMRARPTRGAAVSETGAFWEFDSRGELRPCIRHLIDRMIFKFTRDIPSSEITDERHYLRRREFIRLAGASSLAVVTPFI